MIAKMRNTRSHHWPNLRHLNNKELVVAKDPRNPFRRVKRFNAETPGSRAPVPIPKRKRKILIVGIVCAWAQKDIETATIKKGD